MVADFMDHRPSPEGAPASPFWLRPTAALGGIRRILGKSAFAISDNCELCSLPAFHWAADSRAAGDFTSGWDNRIMNFCTHRLDRPICA